MEWGAEPSGYAYVGVGVLRSLTIRQNKLIISTLSFLMRFWLSVIQLSIWLNSVKSIWLLVGPEEEKERLWRAISAQKRREQEGVQLYTANKIMAIFTYWHTNNFDCVI